MSVKVYSLLLQAYPKAYRDAFGADMLCAFQDMLAEDTASTVWSTVLKELPLTLISEHVSTLHGGRTMKNSWKYQGLLFGIVLGLLWSAFHLMNTLIPLESSFPYFIVLTCIVTPLLYISAGFISSKGQTRIAVSAYAGLLAAVISSLITFLANRGLALLAEGRIQPYTLMTLYTRSLSVVLATSLVSLLCGALFGAVGYWLAPIFGTKRIGRGVQG